MFGLKETDKTYSVEFSLFFKGDNDEVQRPWQLKRDVSISAHDENADLTRALEKNLEAFFAAINELPADKGYVRVEVTKFHETSLRK